MVDLGKVVPQITGTGIDANSSVTLQPFTSDIHRVMIFTAHTSNLNVATISIITSSKVYKILESSSISISVSNGTITITNNSSVSVQYVILT